jgi:hypothetical protein
MKKLDSAKEGQIYIPILIPSWNNPTYVENIVQQLDHRNFSNIFILDNNSESIGTKKLLQKLEHRGHEIIYFKENFGPRFCFQNRRFFEILPRYFVLTDPDLELSINFDQHVFNQIISLTDSLEVGKIGLALSLEDSVGFREELFQIGDSEYTILEWEKQFWTKQLPNLRFCGYLADVDTTFAFYNKRFFNPREFWKAIRISEFEGMSISARHLPWYKKSIIPDDELAFYKTANIEKKFSFYGMGHRES